MRALHAAIPRVLGVPARELGVLALFAGFTLALFGRPILSDPTGTCLCAPYSSDPSIYMWAMEWWPHAIAHGLDPLLPHVIWAPSGVNLAWATGVPSAAFLGYPLVASAGPVAAYNFFMLTAPVLAAYAAYRLCRYLTGAFWPSVAGGYVFGFSSYMLGHLLGHLNLVSVWPIPFLVLLVLMHVDGRISRRAFLLLVVPLGLVEFGFATELFVTTLAFGGFAILIGYLAGAPATRARIRRAVVSIGAAGAVLALLLSPYLFLVVKDRPHQPLGKRSAIAVDVTNVVIPTNLTAVRVPTLSNRIERDEAESGGYFGLPLLAIVGLFVVRERRTTRGRVVGATFLLALAASFGPWLWFAGTRTRIPNPLGGYAFLPIVGNALPARFVLYAFLAAGVALAFWLANARGSSSVRWVVGAAAIAALLPNGAHHWFNRDLPDPPFFRNRAFAQVLRPNENVVVLPYGRRGFSMLWQAQAHFEFRMAGGNIGPQVPPQFDRYPIVQALETDSPGPHAEAELRRFLHDKEVGAVVAAPGTATVWEPLLHRLDPSPSTTGGVQVFNLRRR